MIGVVIVLLPGCPSCFTRSSPGCNFGLNSRFVSNGISTVFVSGVPVFGPCLITSSTGSSITFPVSGFLIPGLPGTFSV